MSILIKCDIGQAIGAGHYTRSLLLRNTFKDLGVNAQLSLSGVDTKNDIHLEYDVLPGSLDNIHSSTIVLDVYHKKNHESINLQEMLKILKMNKNKVVFIDGLIDDACPKSYYPYIDMLVSPYVFDGKTKKFPEEQHCFGADYLLMDEHKILKNKTIRKNGNRILLTFGGSDLYNQSLMVLKFLKSNARFETLEIMIVIGSLMLEDQIVQIRRAAKPFNNIQIKETITSLNDCFDWADLVITNTGQTRYEAAASGVPFLILPFDKMGYNVSYVFRKLEAAELLNLDDSRKTSTVLNMILSILDNYEGRLKMSQSGIQHFCSMTGAKNLANEILRLINETD